MIGVTVIVKNGEATIERTLESLLAFQEVVVLDTGSTDATLEIVKKFPNVKLFHAPFQGFGPTHNQASRLSSYDWILSIDSDEVLSPELQRELLETEKDSETVYSIPRHNYFRGKRIKGCSGWDPDFVTRLYDRRRTCFDDAAVHEKIICKSMKTVRLRHPIVHVPYRTVEDFIRKMQIYTSLFAEQHRGRKRSSLSKALLHSVACFCKSYFFKRGMLLGFEGFFLSFYNAETTFYKYIKLMEANETLSKNKFF